MMEIYIFKKVEVILCTSAGDLRFNAALICTTKILYVLCAARMSLGMFTSTKGTIVQLPKLPE